MQLPTIPKIGRLSKKHKITAAGAAAAAAVVLAVTGLQATGGSADAKGDPTGFSVRAGQQVKSLDAQAGLASQQAIKDDAAAKKKAAADAAAKQKAAADAGREEEGRPTPRPPRRRPRPSRREEEGRRPGRRAHQGQAGREPSTQRTALKVAPKAVAVAGRRRPPRSSTRTTSTAGSARPWPSWPQHDIPGRPTTAFTGTSCGSPRGNPNAINRWDINAQNGIPPRACSR